MPETETTPAQELREAAQLMRERAKPCDQGPWTVVPGAPGAGTLVTGADWAICRGHDAEARHIASWHPLVALAVADWLEREAFMAGDTEDGQTFYPLKVARAYLGTKESVDD